MRSTLLLSLLAAGCGNSYTYATLDAAVPDLTASAPDLTATNPTDCDLVNQDCPVAPLTKCAFVADPQMMGNDTTNA